MVTSDSKRRLRLILLTVLCELLLVQKGIPSEPLTVDFSQEIGIIRPLHGVNMGPICYRGTVDLSDYHRAIAVPHTRLHDVVWVNAPAVDVSTIFRDFHDNPAVPANYEFAPTDDYIESIRSVGSEIIYRLGESIEHTPRKYRVNPPEDIGRWADVCIGIIKHYNEGWADGFHHDIRYWEIWNEPDVRPSMWTGTDEQYFDLFTTTAKAIKAKFPDLKIGGPALGNVGSFSSQRFVASPFFLEFLKRCKETLTPLDFFSFHRYTADPKELLPVSNAVRRVLDEYGFSQTEIHLNEWNYLPDNDWSPLLKDGQGLQRANWFARMNGPEGASFTAHSLMALQDSPIKVANYFTGDVQGFGLFDFNGTPKKTFYAFKAFRELLKTPIQVKATFGAPGKLQACAGISADKMQASMMISNFSSKRTSLEIDLKHLPWETPSELNVLLVDSNHDMTAVDRNIYTFEKGMLAIELSPYAVILTTLTRPQ